MPPTNLPKRAAVGAVVGGCELVRRIGRGGMAEVWVARRSLGGKTSKFVAIKLMADHYVGDERYARMFRAEAELAAVLSHANIVQVFDEGEEDGRSFLVMEWVDGINLLTLASRLALLDDEQRRVRVIAYVIGQLLHALHYAHSITSPDGEPLCVVHRDVSPQNVLVSNHGEVKLADFGVAHHALEESSGVHVKGKVRYMSPEQLSGCTRAPTVDLYAVGAMLHEMLDGRRFRGEHEDGQELFAAVLSGRVSPLSRPAPPELDELRRRLLEPDPKRRIPTAAQALAQLKRYPGYGDARDELATLCGHITGVVRPRAGIIVEPDAQGDPSQTRRRGHGGRNMVRLRPHAGRRVPAQPVVVRGSKLARRSGPRPMAKGVIQAVEDAPIIGYTGIGRLQSRLDRMTGAAAMGHAPSMELARDLAAGPGSRPARARRDAGEESSSSHTSDPRASPSGSGRSASSSSSSPRYDDASDDPVGSEHEPLRQPPPTVRLTLERSVTHSSMEAGAAMEPGSGSETESILHAQDHARDGSATETGVRSRVDALEADASCSQWSNAALAWPGSFHASPSWRSALKLGLGMGLVALVSASTARWMSTEPTEAARPTVQESTPTTPEPGWPSTTRRPEPPAESPPKPEIPDDDVDAAPPSSPTDRTVPEAPKATSRKAKAAARKVLVKVRGGMGLDRAQVKVASQTVTVGDLRQVLVPPGRKTLQWRADEHDTWKSAGTWRFEPGTTVMAFVTKDGLRLRTIQ